MPKTSTRPLLIAAVVAVVIAAAAATYFILRPRLPGPGSDTYEQVTRAFYRGLASLEVGLLDDAQREFTAAATAIETEPASWANLGLARLRLGELDAAAEPIERALMLAPDHPDLILLAGRMEIARGRLDEGIAHLRRAVDAEPGALRARFALADEIERAAGPNADAEALALLDELTELAPQNAAVQVERARLAGRAGDADRFVDAVARLAPFATAWTPLAQQQYSALQQAAAARDLSRAALAATLLRNVLASVPSFIEDLSAVRTPFELIAEPIDRFIVLPPPPATPAAADTSTTFAAESLGGPASARALLVFHDAQAPAVFAVETSALRRLGSAPAAWPLPEGVVDARLLALDWNNDFRTDVLVVTGEGVHLLLQGEDGALSDGTADAARGTPVACQCTFAWAADVEMDGDLDAVVGDDGGDPIVLRNNGNGAWEVQRQFTGVNGARAFVWADLDEDADPDAAFLDRDGTLHVFGNRQAGEFVRVDATGTPPRGVALMAADLDGDGRFALVMLDAAGATHRLVRDGATWQSDIVATWDGMSGSAPGSHRLFAADLDNNGGLDLIASGAGASRAWLSTPSFAFEPLATSPPADVFAIADVTGDGRLDLLGVTGGVATSFVSRGSAAYHWMAVRPRAQPNAGDQRINSYGIGGDVGVRSGLLVQKHLLTGAPVHVGLGEHTAVDVARIVWPNGVAQAEFSVAVDEVLLAEQRLKGSCPWVFAWDGTRMGFVTDFLWRSPLGLRINAQDTAGVVQTEDWVRITGAQLAPRNGEYDIRITAELWETHFFDHVSLMVVDHPAEAQVYVDERFSAAAPPALQLHAVERVQPVTQAWDHRGRDVTDRVAQRDGQYLAAFAKGAYQGIAEEHFVEFEVAGVPRPVLLASGWIYPTDSSINVAIGQGGHVRPMGLALEAQADDGTWRMVDADLGFPAGKNKTIVVDLAKAGRASRLRLRTNLEIAWDALAVASRTNAPLRTHRLSATAADLRYRGFSMTSSPRGEAPETPHYEQIATTSPRWRDLTGYHTRFGDVRELLAGVDDRYVIMNAGDEMRLTFAEQPPPGDGWTRDYVLVGDGWEKDGDYNTGFSQTVLPLPSHDRPDYGAGVTSLALEDDPVYRRHKADWETYHTRYVTPQRFVTGWSRRATPSAR